MWPFNYFKKKREKAGREHLCQKEEAPLHKLNQESIACERVDLPLSRIVISDTKMVLL